MFINLVIPNSAQDWSLKNYYSDILDGVAALIEKCTDPLSIQKMITRVIQPFVFPLIDKTK